MVFSKEAPWDMATTLHKDIAREMHGMETRSHRHWILVTYTYKDKYWVAGSAHLPTSSSSRRRAPPSKRPWLLHPDDQGYSSAAT